MKKRPDALTFVTVWICPLLILLVCNACYHVATKHASAPDINKEAAKVPDEVSLTADRAKFNEIRGEEAPEVRAKNDELAVILEMMKPPNPQAAGASGDEDPTKIRDRFSRYTRTKREANDRILKQRRDDFNRGEKAKREKFLEDLKAERDSFMSRRTHPTQAQSTAFYADQDGRRQSYFADERDRARSFDSALSEERRTFEDSVREITNKFNEEHRNYSTAYFERKRAETNKKALEKTAERKAKEEADQAALKEFREIPKGPGVPLGAEDKKN